MITTIGKSNQIKLPHDCFLITALTFLDSSFSPSCSAMEAANRRLQAIQRTLSPATPEHWKRVLVLPDGASVKISVPSPSTTRASSQRDAKPDIPGQWRKIAIAGEVVCAYRALPRMRSLVISAVGTPFEDSADHVPKYPLIELAAGEPGASISVADAWGVMNVFHTIYHTQENVPIVLSASPAFANSDELTRYLIHSGLARRRHVLPGMPQPGERGDTEEDVLFLLRQAFWQGAGMAGFHARGWLRASVDQLPGSFPYSLSITRTPLVIAGHPLRPPKPAQGEMVYKRWIPSIGEMFEIVAFDLGADRDVVEGREHEASEHLQLLHKWHNTDRVNRAWGDRGPIEKHRDYVRKLWRDPAAYPVILLWDGKPFGYAEFAWFKVGKQMCVCRG